MAKLLQLDFPFPGPFGAELATMVRGLADSIAKEPGMIWKIWTESETEKRAGGVYLFEDEATLQAYLEMHSERLQAFGVTDLRAMVFDVNTELSAITRGPLGGDPA